MSNAPSNCSADSYTGGQSAQTSSCNYVSSSRGGGTRTTRTVISRLKNEAANSSSQNTTQTTSIGNYNEPIIDFVKRYTPINKKRILSTDQVSVIAAISNDRIEKIHDILSKKSHLDIGLYD